MTWVFGELVVAVPLGVAFWALVLWLAGAL